MTTTRRRALVLATAFVAAGGVAAAAVALGGTGAPSSRGAAAEATAVPSPPSSASSSPPASTTAGAPVQTASPGPIDAATTDEPVAGSPVTPVLAFADVDPSGTSVEAAGFVTAVVESGGECTLRLARGTAEVTTTSPAEPDATTTNCGSLSVPVAELAPGTWQVTLGYRSATSTGVSAPLTVEVRG